MCVSVRSNEFEVDFMNKRNLRKRPALQLKHETIVRLTNDRLKNVVAGETDVIDSSGHISICQGCQTL